MLQALPSESARGLIKTGKFLFKVSAKLGYT